MSRRAKIEQLLLKSPDDVFLNFGLAMELAKEGAIDAAVGQFDRVLTLDPKYISAHFQKGSSLLAAGRKEAGRAALTTGMAVARASGDPHAAEEMQALMDSAG
jgi:lipoprotein NlpI